MSGMLSKNLAGSGGEISIITFNLEIRKLFIFLIPILCYLSLIEEDTRYLALPVAILYDPVCVGL